jgi:hypothetical protein
MNEFRLFMPHGIRGRGHPCSSAAAAELHTQHNRTGDHGPYHDPTRLRPRVIPHRRRANDRVGRVIGVLTQTPYDFWRNSHALHDANSGNLDHCGFGDVDTLIREDV